MDLATVFTAVTSSLGVSAATAAWLSRNLITHRLQKDLEAFKADLDVEKAAVEGRVRQQVEATLGELASERQYVFEARKRLYTAIGPLRFQLLMACRDLAGRIKAQGLSRSYKTNIDGHYGRSSLFRILRPLCLAELVERQIAYADFSVDAGAVDLLRFKKNAFAVFSGGSLVEGHPKAKWNNQEDHVFYDCLSRCANMVIVREDNGQERCMRFHEFEALFLNQHAEDKFAPFPNIFQDMTPEAKPLFWLRLVAYGYLCNDFINTTGKAVGFEFRDYPVSELLAVTKDSVICGNLSEYAARCLAVPGSSL